MDNTLDIFVSALEEIENKNFVKAVQVSTHEYCNYERLLFTCIDVRCYY